MRGSSYKRGTVSRDHVIDADGHVFEPDTLWAEHLSRNFVDRRPRIVRDNRGTTRYLIEGSMFPPGAGRAAAVPEGLVEAGLTREGGINPTMRLNDMDQEGIDVAVLYGTLGRFLWRVADRAFAVDLCRAYNDWVADYCSADPSRLKATPALPLNTMPEALSELERSVTQLNMVAIPLPVSVAGRNPDDEYLDALYRAAEEFDVRVAFHAGGGGFAELRFVDSYAVAHACSFTMDILFGLATVLCGGVLERFPRLRVCFLEAGCGFVPYFLDRLDSHFEKRRHEMPLVKRKPSEYLSEGRCCISCEPDERALPFASRSIGSDKILFASDYPHWDSTFPNSVKVIAQNNELSRSDKRRILGENAKRLYQVRC